MTAGIGTPHRRRLREIWRSAGWPCQDLIEVELLAAGLLERRRDDHGRETLRVTDAGIQILAQTLQRNRAARSAHEALVARVAHELARAGRIAWCGLSLRAKVPDLPLPSGLQPHGDTPAAPLHRWQISMPDVYSIRHTAVAGYLQPIVHEIKVHRADLLSDLRHGAKRAGYQYLAGECWYVLRDGIAQADEIPAEWGVMVAGGPDGLGALDVLRPAPRRAMPFEAGLPFPIWMALARATPLAMHEDEQHLLGDLGMPLERLMEHVTERPTEHHMERSTCGLEHSPTHSPQHRPEM